MQVSREFTFDAAHRITNHPGKCRSCHGHTWRVQVTVDGPVDSATGMVLDFYDLKRIGAALFDERWDHAALLASWDPLVSACQKVGSRLEVFPWEPTSENLAQEIVRYFRDLLPPAVRLARVQVWETPNCSAAVCLEG